MKKNPKQIVAIVSLAAIAALLIALLYQLLPQLLIPVICSLPYSFA